jgi:hypothetical protein
LRRRFNRSEMMNGSRAEIFGAASFSVSGSTARGLLLSMRDENLRLIKTIAEQAKSGHAE